MFLTVAALVLAAALGIWAQRRLHRGRLADDPRVGPETLSTAELINPVRTLSALLLAFVLVAVFQSFRAGGDDAATEAGAVLAMGENAVLLEREARADVLGSLRCYARSVAGPEWRSQQDDGGLSLLTDRAADEISHALEKAAAEPRNALAIGAILSENGDRVQARIQRLDQALPAVPGEVWALLIVAVALMVGAMATLGHPEVRGHVQLGVLAATVVVFGLTLLVVYDLDRPYGGPARVDPTAMLNVDRRLAALPGGNAAVRCDADGRYP